MAEALKAAAATTVVFPEPGPLGIAFLCVAESQPPRINSIVPGSQAGGHAGLAPGLELVSVGERDSRQCGYDECLELIRRAGCPLRLEFAPPGSQPASAPPAREAAATEDASAGSLPGAGAATPFGRSTLPAAAPRTRRSSG